MAVRTDDRQQVQQQASIIAVLELCDRGCLQDALDLGWLLTQRSRALAQPHLPAVIVHTAAEVAAGLAALHAADVVHCDRSAYNVMLSSQGGSSTAGGGSCCTAALWCTCCSMCRLSAPCSE